MPDLHTLSRLYWNLFLVAFFVIALWESFQPRRAPLESPGRRWRQHGALALAANLTALLFRTSPLLVAFAVAEQPFGLLNHPTTPFWLRCTAGVLLLDATRYVQHRLMHATPLLWKLHQVHHSDEDFDLTTGLRFHPIEAALTQGSYLLVVAILAPPVEAVLIAELATVIQNFFAHANVRIPPTIERRLRSLIVTPELHRVHHSVRIAEQNTNFGSLVPYWDRLFGTYLGEPAGGQDGVRFGLRELEPGSRITLRGLITMPFDDARQHRRRSRNRITRVAPLTTPALEDTRGNERSGIG